jgi:hypothetical protein
MRLLLPLLLLVATTSCVPAWSAREIAGKADKGIVSRMAGEWSRPPATWGPPGDVVTLSMLPGRTSQFRFARGRNLERWTINPVKIGNRTFADIKLVASANDSTTLATWGVPADTLKRYHLLARLDVKGDSLLVGFLDDDKAFAWLEETRVDLDYGQFETHGTDLTLVDRSDRVRLFLKTTQDVDSLFSPPVVFVRGRLAGNASRP